MAEDNTSDKTGHINEVAPQRPETVEKARGPYNKPDLSSIFPLSSRIISTTPNTGTQGDNSGSTSTGTSTGNAGEANSNTTDANKQ